MYTDTFKNEFQNSITVKIETGPESLQLQLIGPTSVMENIITYKEAEEIHKGLTICVQRGQSGSMPITTSKKATRFIKTESSLE